MMNILHFLPPFLISMGLLGCGQSSGPSVNTPAQPAAPAPAPVVKKEVGLVMKTLTNPFFVEMEKGARRAEKELGINLTVKTAAQETSIEQQIQLVEDLIAAKVNAIVIAPGDSQRLIPALKKAREAGISIVNIDNRLDPEAVNQAGMAPVPFVSVDNEAGAYKAGKFLADSVSAPTEAAILEGIRSADNAQQRAAGARRALAENPKIKLVASETANWKIDEAYTVTRQMFAKHPQIKLLFASNDIMAIGALKYLQESRRRGVMVAGFDALDEALTEIRSKRLAATVDQQAAEQGYQGVALALRLTQGSTVPAVTTIDTRLVTAGNLP
ncbi:substrate-binding domain-containing protein [Rhodoferax sp. 4810]|nr:substrate-binding domain-containing protein [Rhodoferax jenense]